MLEKCARAIYGSYVEQMSADSDAGYASWEANHAKEKWRAVARAVMARLWQQIDLALFDMNPNDAEGFARGHAHAKNVVRAILQSKEEGEGR